MTALWFAAVALVPARPDPPVNLEIESCVPVEAAEVRRIVSIELASLVESHGASPEPTRVDLRCKEGDIVDLRVDDPATGKSLSRTLELGAVAPKARDRLLALAIAELVAASEPELPTREPPDAIQIDARTRAPAPPSPPLRIEGLFGARTFPSASVVLVGGGVRLSQDRGEHWGWSVDVLVDDGSAETPRGNVRTDTVTGSGCLLASQHLGRATIFAGAGARMGWARMEGTLVVDGPSGGVLGTAGMRAALTRRVSIEAHGETGLTLFPVVGQQTGRDLAIDDLWFGGQVGIALAF